MPPRRSSRISGRDHGASFRSNSRSSSTTNSPTPFSNDSLNEAPSPFPAVALSSDTPENAAGQLTSPDKDCTSQSKGLSFTATSTYEPREKTLAPASPAKRNIEDGAQEQTLANLPGADISDCNATEDESVVGKVNASGYENLTDGETPATGIGGTISAGESGKKVVKKKVKIVKVVKRMVPKKVVKRSLQTEQVEREENVCSLILHSQNEDSDPLRNESTSKEIENGDNPIPFGSNSIDTDNPSKFDSVHTVDNNLSKTVSLEVVGNEGLKEVIVGSMEVDSVSPSSQEPVEGENSGLSTWGVPLDFDSDDRRDGMEEEKIETQAENQAVGSEERHAKERFEDQSLVSVEAGVNAEDMAVKEVIENIGVGLNGLVAMSGEMEALERKRKRKTEIFIGGLDKDVKEEDIRKVFEQVGEVKEVRLMMDSKTGKSRGFAFLRFASAADAKEALAKYSEVEICGKQCGARPVEGNDTIFLGNINRKWKTDDVLELMKKARIEKIDCVTVMVDPSNSEQNRGFAFVEIETSKDAQIAFSKLQNDFLIKQMKIAVAWAQPLIEPDEEEVLKVKSVYAEFLPSSWDEAKARAFFQRFGEIVSITLAKNIPSSKRKDFAFVNYTSRENALACIEAFNHDQLDDDDSKVTVKVSLAKPMTKFKKARHASVSSGREFVEDKPKIPQPMLKTDKRRNQGRPISSIPNSIIMDKSASTTNELIQLLRKQASGGLSRAGSYELNHDYPLSGNKRPFSAMGNCPPSADPRGHPRIHSETSHSTGDASAFPHPARMVPFPYPQQRNTSYAFESAHGIQNYQHFQVTERAPYFGPSGLYRRY